ncbi:MAG: TraB/GumN family protein [Gammaproteobacteria bacterium]|nr:TraB/GumN family protein [Gammaproteobacteria bacterium]
MNQTTDTTTAATLPPQPITRVRWGDSLITLLGTAHVSAASEAKVRELLATGEYDAVAVELCPSRESALMNPDALAKMDLYQVVRKGQAAMVAASLALGAFQQRMAEQVGIQPGAELKAAVEVARESNTPVLLIDREIGTTLKRVIASIPWWRRINLIGGLLLSLVSREQVSEAEIERLKEGDVLESTFAQFAEEEKSLYEPLVAERDRYMALKLQAELAAEPRVHLLAVVGAGHLAGIAAQLRKSPPGSTEACLADLAELEKLPPPRRWHRLIPWLVVALVFTGFAIGFSRNPDLGWLMVKDWVLINGTLTALGALLAWGHPLTVITGFFASPLTSLNPTIGAGMVTAGVESYLRKPLVADFSRLRQDSTSVKGWWRNRVTRTLLVFIFSTLGSAAGTYIAGFRILDRLAGG